MTSIGYFEDVQGLRISVNCEDVMVSSSMLDVPGLVIGRGKDLGLL